MNCHRAFEIDLEDLLADPESDDCRSFETHAAGCPDCAGELAVQRALLARLRDEEPQPIEHPADAALLRLARTPDELSSEQRTSLRAHLRDCPPCDDAYRATLMLVPEPAPSPLASALAALRGWLTPSAARAWVPIAAALVLAVGVTLRLGLPGPDGPAPELRFRSAPGEFAMELELAADERSSLSLYGLEADAVVLLRLALPSELRGTALTAKISPEDGAPVFEGPVSWDPEDESGGFIEPRVSAFERDSYRIDVADAAGTVGSFTVDVR
jgi:hypothetical protein